MMMTMKMMKTKMKNTKKIKMTKAMVKIRTAKLKFLKKMKMKTIMKMGRQIKRTNKIT